MQSKVVTANTLVDGVVVYQGTEGKWTPLLADAHFVTDESEQARLLDAAQQDVTRRVIVDPYLMDVSIGADGPEPVSQRERIRAAGPTVQTQFNTLHPES